jgi:hypothetical protein
MLREKINILIEKFTESWTACMVCMVQGDLSVLTLNHAYTASHTGVIAGIALVISSFLPYKNAWIGIFLTGVFTSIADILVHPSHFGTEFTESIVTGIGAMGLAIVFHKCLRKNTHKQTQIDP